MTALLGAAGSSTSQRRGSRERSTVNCATAGVGAARCLPACMATPRKPLMGCAPMCPPAPSAEDHTVVASPTCRGLRATWQPEPDAGR